LFAQRRVGDFLHGDVLINRHARGGGGTLAHDHEDRLHADAAIGDVRRAQADGDEQIFAFGLLWNDAAIANGIGLHADLHIAFVFHVAVAHDAAAIVRIHVIRTEADGVVELLDLPAHPL